MEATECPSQPMAQIEISQLRKSQREDSMIGKWMRAVVDQHLPDKHHMSKEDQIMRKNFSRFRIVRGVLYREIQDGDNKIQQLVIPQKYIDQVLTGLHNDVGHPGKDRTTSLVRERFFWPLMTLDIEKWVNECDRCLRRKTPTNTRAPLVSIQTTYPLELVCMDFLTVDPCKGGFGNVLVITDHYTRYALAIPTKNQTARTTAEAFYNHFIVNYGIPTRIHSDQGPNFASDLMKELCKLLNIEKSQTTPYHPMGNGTTERFNRTLLDMLGTLELDKKEDWKKYLPTLVYAYNCTKHEVTKFAPFELMFGRKPKLPIDSLFKTVDVDENRTPDNYIEGLKKRMQETHDVVQRYATAGKKKQKAEYDKKVKFSKIEVGDKVLLKILAFQGKHKIADRFEQEIYTVVKQPNEDIPVYVIRSPSGLEKTLHRNHLFPIGKSPNEKGTDTDQIEDEDKEQVKITQNLKGVSRKDAAAEKVQKETDNRVERDEDSDEESGEYVVLTYRRGDAHKPDTYNERLESRRESHEEIESEEETERSEDNVLAEEPIPERQEREPATGRNIPKEDATGRARANIEEDQTIGEANFREETARKELLEEPVTRPKRRQLPVIAIDESELPRRSTRERKKPKWLEPYHTSSAVNRPADNKLFTLGKLFQSGILNELSSDISHIIIKAVLKS